MKKSSLVFILLFCLAPTSKAQTDSVVFKSTWEMSKIYALPNNKLNWHHEESAPNQPPLSTGIENVIIDNSERIVANPCITDCGEAKGIDVQIGHSFETNHYNKSYPLDNNLAISNDGKIVSVDNATIAYFHENGDSIVQFGLNWNDFYGIPSADKISIFDPKVIYDRYSDRFVLVTICRDISYDDSRILLSFSQSNPADSISWNHYQIHCDTVYNGIGEQMYWFDYPNIAVNKNEFFLTLNVFERDSIAGSSTSRKSCVFQILKQDGYNALSSIDIKEWTDVMNGIGQPAYSLVPLQDALQKEIYVDTMYFVNTKSQSSATYYWYDLFGDVYSTSNSINSHTTATSLFYSVPSYASQMGGNADDRISFGDARLQSGYIQNGKIHFVHHRGDNGWGQIVYGRISVSSNTFEYDLWGGDGSNMNYMYPSIAYYGIDGIEENSMITFARTGTNIFNEVCAVNWDGTWSPQTTVVKAGLGILDLVIYNGTDNSYERIGDYTDIQRRYNSQSCWLIGSFPYGSTPNHFGLPDGLNTWVAEIGDIGVGIDEIEFSYGFKVYPNPVQDKEIWIENKWKENSENTVVITNTLGQIIFETKLSMSPINKIEIPNVTTGLIFVTIRSNTNNYETHKILVD